METKDKLEILGEFWALGSLDHRWEEYGKHHTLALYTALALRYGLVTIADEKGLAPFADDAWSDFLYMSHLPDKEYTSLQDCVDEQAKGE